ncbi:uncharacterized protein LOC125646710 [Ostrea edulis]|uniref:uncharacterized protein LOC125646710 n=1 Tax=Ostrea edulis TaxID=37623 RepID=UPI002094E875|nr:uncharacterized protein LOC125646710 [Ostrea edulis]
MSQGMNTLRILVLIALVNACLSVSNRCLPGDSCFPANIELIKFIETLDGKLHFPHTAEYDRLVVQRETIYTKFPVAIAEVKNVADIQKSILFARKYNLLVSVKTSGHDFIGRSTAHGSLMIYVGSMNSTKVNLSSTRSPAGEITCESGNTWLKVYEEVDKYNRVIIGGSAHTVSMAGYTLGGGHSPMSRMFGMAVDNLLELELVTADGRIVLANDQMTHITYPNGSVTTSTDTDIFWASKGGGGGTYGVATKFTFKLHYAAPQVVQLVCAYPIIRSNGQHIGFPVLQKIFSLIQNLPKEWGGYLIGSGVPAANGNWGNIYVALNHYGSYASATRMYVNELYNFHKEWQTFCFYANRTTFLDYEVTAKDPEYYAGYIMNTLLQNDSFTDSLTTFLVNELEREHTNISSFSFTGTLLGGEMMKVGTHDTSVHPGFRTALMSLSATIGWSPETLDYSGLPERGAKVGEQLSQFGNGQYPNEAGMDVINWKSEFWGTNYKRLLDIKHKWDPDNFLTCRECVGSESNGHLSSHHGSHGGSFGGPVVG